jgi:hypothetical protein
MTAFGKYPREWLERVPAVVFACLVPGEFRILLCRGLALRTAALPVMFRSA